MQHVPNTLTPPNATIATPLLNPTTATGLLRLFCKQQTQIQPTESGSKCILPLDTHNSPLKHHLQKGITWGSFLLVVLSPSC
jgi:hypothetical protein